MESSVSVSSSQRKRNKNVRNLGDIALDVIKDKWKILMPKVCHPLRKKIKGIKNSNTSAPMTMEEGISRRLMVFDKVFEAFTYASERLKY